MTNDKVVNPEEQKSGESALSKNTEANQARNADAKTMGIIQKSNPDAITGTPTAVLAIRDGDTLDQSRVRAIQGKQQTMGLIDSEAGIIHTAAGMIPLIKDDCPYALAVELNKIVAKNETDLAEKIRHAEKLVAAQNLTSLEAKVLAEVPQPVPPASSHAHESAAAAHKSGEHTHNKSLEKHKPVEAPHLKPEELQKLKQKFQSENGVEITVSKEGKLEYRLSGLSKPLCTFDQSPAGIEKAAKEIEKQRLEKQHDLETTYGAKFSKNGDKPCNQIYHDAKTNQWFEDAKQSVVCRAPKLNELYGIEAALKVSQPSAHGITFYIATNQLYRNETEMADYHPQPAGTPAVFVNGNATLRYPSTEEAAKHWKHDGSDWSNTSLEHSLTHELVHHSEAKMNWDKPYVKSPTKTFGTETATSMGWVPPKVPTRDTHDWYLKDKQGHTWKHENMLGNNWVRLNTNGQPIDEHEKPCAYAKVHRISNEEMMKIAKVRPATTYNDTPQEMFCEAMTRFRDGPRSQLWKENREMYKIVKDADQREINKVYPLDAHNHPTYIRAANGQIVKNTPAAQVEIHKLEK